PVLLRADRTVEVLSGPNDLMIGFDPVARRRERATTLRVGDRLLLYTDGLIERRDRSLDQGLARLVEVLGSVSGQGLEATCDAILDGMVPSERADDVALLMVRAL